MKKLLFIPLLFLTTCYEIPEYFKEYKVIDKQTIIERDFGFRYQETTTYLLLIEYKSKKKNKLVEKWIIVNKKIYNNVRIGRIYTIKNKMKK